MTKATGEIVIKGTTKLIALIGRKIDYTLSPPMHNAVFHSLGLEYVYIPLPVEPEHLNQAIEALRALNFVGVNVTIPYKQTVIPMLDDISEDARMIGAVNTIKVRKDKSLIGYNTDIHGFLESVKEEMDFVPDKHRVVIIGAGGAGRAIAMGCVIHGAARVALVDIDRGTIDNLKKDLESVEQPTRIIGYLPGDKDVREEIENADLVANATPVGIQPGDKPPIPLDNLHNEAVVFDAIYAVRETSTMRAAREAGCTRLINGMGMLVHQGAKSFEIWTERTPDISLMRSVVESHVYNT